MLTENARLPHAVGVALAIVGGIAGAKLYSGNFLQWRWNRRCGERSETVTPYDTGVADSEPVVRDEIASPLEVDESDRVPYSVQRHEPSAMASMAESFYNAMWARRSIRDFSSEHVSPQLIQRCAAAAGLAPSGANLQPWTFAIVVNPSLKASIRAKVEAAEYANYSGRMKASWLADIAKLGTTWEKPYLTTAPALVLVFKHLYRVADTSSPDGAGSSAPPHRVGDVYYPEQSVGIATGVFVAALTAAGLSTLVTTPMGAEADCRRLVGRGEHERLCFLMPVGYPTPDCTVPRITKRDPDEFAPIVS